ncbi:hypothetical protein AcV5_002092 [Taiwanofungus camphoratus]|nr:hypothetical protein AcV5_002092 [Antrodia cinnamomea]
MASSDTATAADKLVLLTQYLGGPRYSPKDIEWAADLPVGKALIEWLANQVTDSDLVEESILEDYSECLRYRTSLEAIALEDEEIKEAQRAEELGILDIEGISYTEITSVPLEYAGPSALRSRYEYMDAEAELLETETNMLKHRLKSASAMSKQLKETIKVLRSSLSGIDSQMIDQQERLAELSIRTDISIAKSTSAAMHLLDSIRANCLQGPKSRPVDTNISAYKSKLSSMSIIRSNIVDRAEEGLRVVDEASNSLPSKDEVRWEIERLQHNLSKLRYPSSAGSGRSGDNIPNLAVTSYHTELEKMCGQIEGARDETERRRFLDDILSQADDSSTDIDNEVDIRAELSHAWTLDQAALLTARENVMNETEALFEEHLLSPLTQLHKNLSTTTTVVVEAEAVVSALIEELEEVVDDVQTARESTTSVFGKTSSYQAQCLLEAQLVELLKHMTTREPDRLLVLLNRSDLEDELGSVHKRAQDVERAEEEWASTLTKKLSTLINSHAPLVSTIYANSSVHTSPPFTPASDNRALEAEARERTGQLSAAVVRLQKEAEINTRDKRRLDAFVEKWTRN